MEKIELENGKSPILGGAHMSLSISKAWFVMFVGTGWVRQGAPPWAFPIVAAWPLLAAAAVVGGVWLWSERWGVWLMQPRVLSLVVQGKALPQAAAFGGWMRRASLS